MNGSAATTGHTLQHVLPAPGAAETVAFRPAPRAVDPATAAAGPRPGARDTSRDGLRNKLEGYALTHFGPFWRLANRLPWLEWRMNRLLVNTEVNKAETRPHPFSARSAYTSWESLNDRTWNGRYLPAAEIPDLPAVRDAAALFLRPAGGGQVSNKSTYLFPAFAQWFTDGFLRTDDRDRLRNTSNHEIDLSPLYGRRLDQTDALRLKSPARGERGRLKSQLIGPEQEEYAPFLYEQDGTTVRPEFAVLDAPLRVMDGWPLEKRRSLFAFGGDRANSSFHTAMLNTLFLREHNRLAGVLEKAHPDWDDERVFQTARNVLVVILIKIVVEEYINHISPYHFQFRADPRSAWDTKWDRANWITAEFNLLYRWHALVPDALDWGGRPLPIGETLLDNRVLLDGGLGPSIELTSRQRVGRLALFNVTEALLPAQAWSIQQGRDNALASYNDYRQAFAFPRVDRFEQISGDPAIVEGLRATYRTVDQVEFFVGIFAEDAQPNSAVPPTIGRMVSIDAYSQALTNPLLGKHVYREETFSAEGMQAIRETGALKDLVRRNVRAGDRLLTTMTRPQWRRQ